MADSATTLEAPDPRSWLAEIVLLGPSARARIQRELAHCVCMEAGDPHGKVELGFRAINNWGLVQHMRPKVWGAMISAAVENSAASLAPSQIAETVYADDHAVDFRPVVEDLCRPVDADQPDDEALVREYEPAADNLGRAFMAAYCDFVQLVASESIATVAA